MSATEQPSTDFEALLRRHIPELRGYVRRNMGADLAGRESCADLVQSVCREALQARERYRFQGEEAFRKWLLQIALRTLIDRRRAYAADKRERVKREVDLPSTWRIEELAKLMSSLGSPSSEAVLREDVHHLGRALQKLSENDSGIIRMIHIDGLTHADVAERLGCSEELSRSRLFHALARLAELLSAEREHG
jgi:RNA polymerase sigma-70 factor (ECF subfamily)